MNVTAMPSNTSTLAPSSVSAIIPTLVNSTLLTANQTLADVGRPPEDALRKAAANTHLLLNFIMLKFVLLWLLCFVLVIHVRFKSAAAFKGDNVAARKIILSAFEPLLVVLSVFNCICMIVMCAVMGVGYFDNYVPLSMLEAMYSAHQFGILLIFAFMLQKSMSIPALR